MIDFFSRKVTELIKENLNGITSEKEAVIEYGIKILVYELVVIFFAFIIAILFGILKYFLVAFIIYSTLRLVEGGAHMNSRIKCVAIYTAIIFGSILLSKNINTTNPYYSIPVFTINYFVAYKYAPGDSVEKPIVKKKDKIRLKTLSIVFISILFLGSFIMWYSDKTLFNLTLITTLFVTFLLSPLGYKFAKCKRGS